ncbi:molybdenum cofactor biosysynthesis protein [Streptomyces sp. WM6373]|uniref:MOSC domain-containing protein n=1 Tax=Streptomyces TaxID=1883 RepID=UPI0004CC8133|nr:MULTISPECIES: MOSC N-terminal beta barrel domain-containing protein [unclassified Streptomyces]KJY19642.1 molybdenum cofactor biosysynthesis protein [Streptomyces sp. NRRL S-104]KOU41385.1 molybdenum cofactor biosysynthesis protein [Streptomyces sp. WM6373]KOU71330.1 molybdenum cofactor biosysynthesis protein [Streptomyces sp. IGB124]KOU78895.1 molybdenum cofactor biosysynthesis protein [Streptomyces sp. XY58]KOU88433.1 molybdenum cofactor biosysynthesis protein [Streptomyces sp. XY66]
MSKLHVQALHVHPVKSVAGTAPDEVAVEPWGLSGDRRWALIDPEGTVITQRRHPRLALASARPVGGGRIAVTAPDMAELVVEVPEPGPLEPVSLFGKKVETVVAARAAADWFSAFLGVPVRLVHLDDPAVRRPVDPDYALPGETVSLADGYPLLLTTLASLDALNSLIAAGDHPEEGPLPMNRFRPNVVVSGAEAWAEDGWQRLAIGDALFRGARECGRCVVTTTDQRTAERGREPLKTLARHRRIGKSLAFGRLLVPLRQGTLHVGDEVRILA